MDYKIAVIASIAASLLACNSSGQNKPAEYRQEITAVDQSDKAEDQAVTRKIRQALVADKDLSVTASNVQIITRDGIVSLIGTVRNPAEKEKIEKIADRLKGENRLDSRLQTNK